MQRYSFTTNLPNRYGFEVKVLININPGRRLFQKPRDKRFRRFPSRMWRLPSRRYQSTSDRIVIDVTSLSRVTRDDGRRRKEIDGRDSISINRALVVKARSFGRIFAITSRTLAINHARSLCPRHPEGNFRKRN